MLLANQNVIYEPQKDVLWTAPPLNKIKLNVDAAWCAIKPSITVVARGHKGLVVREWSKMLEADDPTVLKHMPSEYHRGE